MAGTARSGGNRTNGNDKTPQDGGPRKPDLPQAVAAKWDELLPQLAQHALRQVDVHELKLLAEVLVMADNLAAAMLADPADHRTGRLYLNTLDRVHRLSASFGLNPADRMRLQLKPDDQEISPMQELLHRRMHRGADRQTG